MHVVPNSRQKLLYDFLSSLADFLKTARLSKNQISKNVLPLTDTVADEY